MNEEEKTRLFFDLFRIFCVYLGDKKVSDRWRCIRRIYAYLKTVPSLQLWPAPLFQRLAK